MATNGNSNEVGSTVLVDYTNILTASKATEISEKALTDGYNIQVKRMMDKIKDASAIGEKQIVLDDHRYVLYEKDYLYFAKLGYTIKLPVTKEIQEMGNNKKTSYYTEYGVISWR